MFEYLNDIAEAAYVSDPETYELVYLNDHAKRQLGVDGTDGRLCYELLQGADAPCPFCTNDRLTCERCVTWEHYNPVTQRRYLLKDRLLERDRPLRIEIAREVGVDGASARRDETLRRAADAAALAGVARRFKEETLLREYNMLMSTLHVAVSKHRFTDDLQIMWANDFFFEMIGYGREEFVDVFDGRCSRYFASDPEEYAKLTDAVAEAHAAGDAGYECLLRMPRKDGFSAWIRVVGRFTDEVADDGVPVLYVTFTNVDEAMELEQVRSDELCRLAFVDPVTGGRNRASFERDAGAALRTAAPGAFALATLDVDGFKVINDQFGLERGDAVLEALHASFQEGLDEGEFAARIAADQFSLLLEADDEARIAARLEDMVAAANRRFVLDGSPGYAIAMTAGVYLVDDPTLPMVMLQDRANLARKMSGRASVGRLCACRFYSNDDRVRLAKEKDVENRMGAALEAGEFVVYLQPKYDLRRDEVAGAEALVRWDDPASGLVAPNDFIPLFERTGFVVSMDLYVFEQVCKMLRKWIDAGVRPVPVSVNLSRAHLYDEQFLARFEVIRARYGVPASLVEFELTETLVFEDPERLAQVIDSMHEAGYKCSMDDFGSGYSSLNVLKDLAVDTLKLDRVFFDASALGDARGADIIDIVVQLARRLGMRTVAEGVETEDQRAFLVDVGCDMIQGYLFSRPVDIASFERLVYGAEVD